MKRTFAVLSIVILLLASGGMLYAKGQADASKAAPIKLGGVWPLSDITGDQGSKAAQLAVKEINAAGGVLGRKLELIVVDDEMTAAKGASALEKLATVDKVDIFLGGVSSGVSGGGSARSNWAWASAACALTSTSSRANRILPDFTN